MRALPIDELVRWAYRVELPKEPMARAGARFLRQSSTMAGWAALSKSGELGTEVDEPDARNRFGLFPDTLATVEPHPDAIRLWHGVRSLAGMNVDLPDQWDPLSDVREGLQDAVSCELARAAGIERIFYHVETGATVTVSVLRHGKGSSAAARIRRELPVGERRLGLRRDMPDLIQRQAINGNPPGWETEIPVKQLVRHLNGQPRWFRMLYGIGVNGDEQVTEGDGYDHKAHRPYPGAYQKFYYDPDLADIVEDRAEYWVWFEALTRLAALLKGALDDHEVLPPSVPAVPWATPGARQPRVIVAA